MPLVKPDLDFVFGLKARLGEMVVVGETPEGLRRMIPILDGSFTGRRCTARCSAAARTGSSCAATASRSRRPSLSVEVL